MKSLLAVLCVVLVGVIARSAFDWPREAVDIRANAPLASLATVAGDGKSSSEALIADIVARPLFNPDRRMHSVATVVDASDIEPTVMPMQGPPPRLAGVMSSPNGAEALFSRDRGFVSARAGDMIDGWTVARIEDQRVVLLGMSGELVLEPTGTRTGGKPPAALGVTSINQRPTPAWAAANPAMATAMALTAIHSIRGDPYALKALNALPSPTTGAIGAPPTQRMIEEKP